MASKAGIQATKLNDQIDKLYKKLCDLIQAEAERLTPLESGDIISLRDESNRLAYYRILEIDGRHNVRDKKIEFALNVFRCTKDGIQRSRRRYLTQDAIKGYDLVKPAVRVK